ncbi:MAG TPA: class I SAM-dependent methyltransferase [Xanthomonadales bacterium]|nr:class I SAM-dependent methyltransferase [Xanthomonadales bacterium]
MEPSDPDPTRRFSDRADDYARFRPSYPVAAIDAILAGLAPPAALTIADVAAGTGIATRLLAERGARVLAVEPNAAMRAAAAPHPRVTWHAGTAEATGLPANAHDVVTVAQAFHWFDAPAALRELQRILRPGGRLAIVWNKRSRDDAFTLGYRHALEAIDGDAPAERSTFDPDTVTSTGRFTAPRLQVFPNTQALALDELIGRALSTSTVPKSGPRTDELLRLLRELHARHRDAAGRATMVYRTEVYLWVRTAADGGDRLH